MEKLNEKNEQKLLKKTRVTGFFLRCVEAIIGPSIFFLIFCFTFSYFFFVKQKNIQSNGLESLHYEQYQNKIFLFSFQPFKKGWRSHIYFKALTKNYPLIILMKVPLKKLLRKCTLEWFWILNLKDIGNLYLKGK